MVFLSEEEAKKNETKMSINTTCIQHYMEILAKAMK